MKNTILLLTLLFSVNAFADHSTSKFVWSGKCLNGNCTRSEIEAENKANYQKHLQHIQDLDAEQEEEEREWSRQHDEDQARADALPKAVYVPSKQVRTCVQDVLEQATGILGDDAENHIDVWVITPGKCGFAVKQFGDLGRGCDNLAALSGIAKIGYYQEQICKFEAEKWEVYLRYKDVLATPAWTEDLSREYSEKMNVVQLKHLEIVVKMNEQEKALNKDNK